jgi:predicted MPP superfamily phosphohydrolase
VRARTVLLAAGAAAGVVLAYATVIEPRRVQLTRTRIHVRGLPESLEGLRIGLLTDMHAGRLTSRRTLRRAVEHLMAARPDIIALTGDFADRRRDDYAPAFRALAPLRAPLGVYAVPGNHDHAVGIGGWYRAMSGSPHITDATNRYHMRSVGDANICIAGVDDLEEGSPELALPSPEERDFTLLLAHNPDTTERSRRSYDAIDLIVSGHTHGGQVRLPGIGAVERKSEFFDSGLQRRPWTQVYTSRGVGSTLLPMRFGAPPEVALLELTSAPRGRS